MLTGISGRVFPGKSWFALPWIFHHMQQTDGVQKLRKTTGISLTQGLGHLLRKQGIPGSNLLFVSFSTRLQTEGLPSQNKLYGTLVWATHSPSGSQEQEPEPEISCSRARSLWLFVFFLWINHYLSYLIESRRSNMCNWDCLWYLSPIPQEYATSHLVRPMSAQVGGAVPNSLGQRNQSGSKSPTSQPQPYSLELATMCWAVIPEPNLAKML